MIFYLTLDKALLWQLQIGKVGKEFVTDVKTL